MNIEIETKEDHVRVAIRRSGDIVELQLYSLGTSFEFNGSTEFIARLDGSVVKPFGLFLDD